MSGENAALIVDGTLHPRLQEYLYELLEIVENPEAILLVTSKWCPTCGYYGMDGMCHKDPRKPRSKKRHGRFTAEATCWVAKASLRLIGGNDG